MQSNPVESTQKSSTPADQSAGLWHLFRTSFTPRKDLAGGRAHIRFRRISGRAEIWLDGKLIGKKTLSEPGEILIGLPKGEGQRQINVLVQGEAKKPAGIDGLVAIEPGVLSE